MRTMIRAIVALFVSAAVAGTASAQYVIRTFAGGGPPDGTPATDVGFHCGSIAVDAGGNLYVAGGAALRIFKVSPGGILTTIAGTGVAGLAGDGGPAMSAQLAAPVGVTLNRSGDLLVIDKMRIRKIQPNGTIVTVAGNGTDGFSGDGGPATSARLFAPQGIAQDNDGNLFIPDMGNHRVRKVSAAGTISTIAGNGSDGFSGDGGLAVAASLSAPSGVAVDGSGNIYIADSMNNRIRRVSAAGVITTIAGRSNSNGFAGDGGLAVNALLSFPTGIFIDSIGNLIFSDMFNHRVRMITVTGVITTVAGNGIAAFGGDGSQAINAQLNRPFGVTMDRAGNLFIGEFSRVRKVSTNGVISTVAGNGTEGFSGDAGLAINAALNAPNGVAVDNTGSVIISDTGNNRLRRVSVSGIITTVAGNGVAGSSGDGGPATGQPSDFPGVRRLIAR